MECVIVVAATIGSPFAPADGSDGYALMSAGSIRVTGYPVGAGVVAGTLTDDGNPADALLLMEEPALPGQEIRARPVALLHTLVDGLPRTEVLCVPAHDANFAALTDVAALRAWHADEGTLATVLHRLQRGHRWRITELEEAPAAEKFLAEARHCHEGLTWRKER
ncbi:inorganic diphosphatase [Streptomyces bauhiniae]|uniref:inorganic diphosphatase n=1 Tax=Streptomyces bauhiniae TaxID=2340725 RepID=UPI00362961EA